MRTEYYEGFGSCFNYCTFVSLILNNSFLFFSYLTAETFCSNKDYLLKITAGNVHKTEQYFLNTVLSIKWF